MRYKSTLSLTLSLTLLLMAVSVVAAPQDDLEALDGDIQNFLDDLADAQAADSRASPEQIQSIAGDGFVSEGTAESSAEAAVEAGADPATLTAEISKENGVSDFAFSEFVTSKEGLTTGAASIGVLLLGLGALFFLRAHRTKKKLDSISGGEYAEEQKIEKSKTDLLKHNKMFADIIDRDFGTVEKRVEELTKHHEHLAEVLKADNPGFSDQILSFNEKQLNQRFTVNNADNMDNSQWAELKQFIIDLRPPLARSKRVDIRKVSLRRDAQWISLACSVLAKQKVFKHFKVKLDSTEGLCKRILQKLAEEQKFLKIHMTKEADPREKEVFKKVTENLSLQEKVVKSEMHGLAYYQEAGFKVAHKDTNPSKPYVPLIPSLTTFTKHAHALQYEHGREETLLDELYKPAAPVPKYLTPEQIKQIPAEKAQEYVVEIAGKIGELMSVDEHQVHYKIGDKPWNTNLDDNIYRIRKKKPSNEDREVA